MLFSEGIKYIVMLDIIYLLNTYNYKYFRLCKVHGFTSPRNFTEPKSSVRVWRIRLQLKASVAVRRISQPGKTFYYHSWSWHEIHPYRKLVYTHPKNIRVDVERQKY